MKKGFFKISWKVAVEGLSINFPVIIIQLYELVTLFDGFFFQKK